MASFIWQKPGQAGAKIASLVHGVYFRTKYSPVSDYGAELILPIAMIRVILTVVFWLAGSASVWCQPTMQFKAFPPDPLAEKLMGMHGWTVYATGEIDSQAGQRLAALLAEDHIPIGSDLYLDSPGGNLAGGMTLGRVIRQNELHTFIGKLDPNSKFHGSKSAACYSACAIAFLGGEFRYWMNGSVFGVHRFFWKKHTSNDANLAQVISAALVEYIASMGVDTKLFSLASQAGPEDIITPSHETLLAPGLIIDVGQKWPRTMR